MTTHAGLTRGHEAVSEEREALSLVGYEVVPDGDRSASTVEPATVRHGLPLFDEVAVVDHTHERPEVVVSSGPLVAAAVELEGRLGEGPTTEAAATGEAVVCRDLEHDRRWRKFAAETLSGHLALRRFVAVPLAVPGEAPIGSIVFAAGTPGIITPGELAAVGALADRCSLSLTARVASGREARAVVATDTVRVVGLAVGVLMAREGLSEPVALDLLRLRSQETGYRLADTAVAVLTEYGMSFR